MTTQSTYIPELVNSITVKLVIFLASLRMVELLLSKIPKIITLPTIILYFNVSFFFELHVCSFVLVLYVEIQMKLVDN